MAIMEKIPGKSNGFYYHQNDGFTYVKDKDGNENRYLRCMLFRKAGINCSSRVTINKFTNEIIEAPNPEHCHPPDHNFVKLRQFRNDCIAKVTSETRASKNIYTSSAANYPAAVVGRWPYVRMEGIMKKKRRQYQPRIPRSLVEYGTLLDGPARHFGVDLENGESFYRYSNARYLLFISPRTDRLLNEELLTTMDGTFKSLPKVLKAYQILTIAVVKEHVFFPVCYIIMKNKTQELYIEVFEKIKELYPNWNPLEINCDFENGMRKAINRVFPQCSLTGCWFHFSQAIMRRVAKNRLKGRYKDDDLFRKYVRMIMAIALLPSESIEDAFQELVQLIEINQMEQLLRPIIIYMHNYWIRKIGASKISVYKKEERTNNQHESFHSHLTEQMNNSRSACNPNLWSFTRGLQEIEHSYAGKLSALESGQEVRFPKKSKWLEHNQRIANATARLDQNQIDILSFLNICSHHVGDLHFQDDEDEEMVDDLDYPMDGDAEEIMEEDINGAIIIEEYEEEIVTLDDL